MKADVAQTSPFERVAPGGLDRTDGIVPEWEEEARCFPSPVQEQAPPFGERTLAGLPLWSLGFRHKQQPAIEVYVFPPLTKDLAPPHAGIQCRDDNLAKMLRSSGEKEL